MFAGRGSDAQRLRGEAKTRGLDNVVFHDEIDPAEMIEREGMGRVCTDHSVATLQRLGEDLVQELIGDTNMSDRCRALSAKLFSPAAAVKQITAALTS